MFEQYSYKKKFMALLVVFALLLVTAYKRSFSMLQATLIQYDELSSKVSEMNKKNNNVEGLSKDIDYLDKVIGKEGVAKEAVQQGIIGFVSEKHPEVSVSDLQPIHMFSDENYNIITNQLDVTGKAGQLLQLSYDFEKAFGLSRMVSMNFYTTSKNNKTENLHLKMIFQNYENNK